MVDGAHVNTIKAITAAGAIGIIAAVFSGFMVMIWSLTESRTTLEAEIAKQREVNDNALIEKLIEQCRPKEGAAIQEKSLTNNELAKRMGPFIKEATP